MMTIPTPQEVHSQEYVHVLGRIVDSLRSGSLTTSIRCANVTCDTRTAIEKELLQAGWIVTYWGCSLGNLHIDLAPRPLYGSMRRVGWLRHKEVYTEQGWVREK